MNIVLFGGSFNPPHLGHKIIIAQAFELIPDLDELWILPCFRHTFQKNLAPAKDRLAMCQLLLDNLAPDIKTKVRLETVEIDKRLSGETLEALHILKKNYPQNKFSFLMGTDQLGSFNKWKNWEKLIQELPFYIYPRAGYSNSLKFPNMTLLSSPTQVVTNLSSTLIRQRLEKNLPINHLIPKTIYNYIKTKRLYEKAKIYDL